MATQIKYFTFTVTRDDSFSSDDVGDNSTLRLGLCPVLGLRPSHFKRV